MSRFLLTMATLAAFAVVLMCFAGSARALPKDTCGVGPPPPGCAAGCLWDYQTCLCFCGDGSGNFTCENDCAQTEAACSAKCGT